MHGICQCVYYWRLDYTSGESNLPLWLFILVGCFFHSFIFWTIIAIVVVCTLARCSPDPITAKWNPWLVFKLHTRTYLSLLSMLHTFSSSFVWWWTIAVVATFPTKLHIILFAWFFPRSVCMPEHGVCRERKLMRCKYHFFHYFDVICVHIFWYTSTYVLVVTTTDDNDGGGCCAHLVCLPL